MTPASDILARMAYRPTAHAGVCACAHPALEPLRVILLNELAPAPHNALLKCFASRRKEQERSFAVLQGSDWLKSSFLLEHLVYGLWRLLMKNAPEIDELTPEYVREAGRELIDAILDATPAEEAMRHYSSEERLVGMAPEERLAGLTEDQIRGYLEKLEKSRRK